MRSGDRAAGVFATSFGFAVFLVFLLFTVQMLFGLYARTSTGAVAADVARRAATTIGPTGLDPSPDQLAVHAEHGRRRLGRYGDSSDVIVAVVDTDGDGTTDSIRVRIDARIPVLVPLRWRTDAGRFTRTAHARIERFQEPAP